MRKTDHLGDDDQFGMILFSHQAYTAKKLDFIKNVDRGALSAQIMNVVELGGTNFEAGFKEAVELHSDCMTNSNDYENRILFLTDAVPNRGATDKGKLFNLVENAANGNYHNERNDTNSLMRIYTTFIGIGIDFNTRLIEYISGLRGANYFCVNSRNDFIYQMADKQQFDCMVTPLIFNLKLSLNLNNWDIEAIYGGNDSKDNKNEFQQIEGKIELIKVATYFATIQRKRKVRLNTAKSKKDEHKEIVESKGGITLIKLKRRGEKSGSNEMEGKDDICDGNDSDIIEVKLCYEDRNNNTFTNSQSVVFENSDSGYGYSIGSTHYFSNTGIRKAVLLSEYVKLIHNWVGFERETLKPLKDNKLQVNRLWMKKLTKFKKHFENEMKHIQDESLTKEMKTLDLLINQSNAIN